MIDNQTLQLPGAIEIELCADGGVFRGLGAVRVNGIALRSPERPWWVEIRTPNGEVMRDFRLVASEPLDDGGVTVSFSMNVENSGVMEWMIHEVRNRRNTGDWAQRTLPAEDAHLRLELRPVTRTLGSQNFTGFSYRFFYESEKFPIYCLLDRGTWEPGGKISGSEFWLRNMTVPPRKRFAGDEWYSTEWHLPGIVNPNVFQFFPFQNRISGLYFSRPPPRVSSSLGRPSLFTFALCLRKRSSAMNWNTGTSTVAI